MKRIFFVGILLAVLGFSTLAGATLYDLKTDWSATANPNGVWTYRQGTTALPLQTDYDRTHLYVSGQHAWANAQFDPTVYGNNLGHVPVWLKATQDNAFDANVKAGDIMVHPTSAVGISAYNQGEANVIWTSPINGTITITGNVWWGGLYPDRAVTWYLFDKSDQLGFGTVGYGDGTSHDNPSTFGSFTRTVSVGDTVMFEAVTASGHQYPWFVGVNLSIDAQPTPLPPAALLLAPGLAGLAVLRRRLKNRL